MYREFAQLDAFSWPPDERTILRFRHRPEKHKLAAQILATVNELLLKAGTVVDATLIAAPSSTKNKDKGRDPEMHSSQKGRQWYFGMKAHISAGADSGLVHTVAARRATCMTCLRATACCMATKPMPLGTQATKSTLKNSQALDLSGEFTDW